MTNARPPFAFGGGNDRRSASTRVLRFDREKLSLPERAQVPSEGHVEVDADGTAYLCIAGARLFFAESLERLIESLELPSSCFTEGASADGEG
jgi:hypothetical protein